MESVDEVRGVGAGIRVREEVHFKKIFCTPSHSAAAKEALSRRLRGTVEVCREEGDVNAQIQRA
jgi:hypothetical protein